MENIMKISASSRQETGKKIAKKLRNEGRIPAIIYGREKESIPISLALADVKSILKQEKKENTILRIMRDDINVDAMLKELQYDYLSDNIVHADFIRIDLEKEIDVDVPVEITGEAVGVKTEDGIFDFMTRELTVRCLPVDIPSKIVVDITDLHAGNSIKVADLEADEKIKFLSDDSIVICLIASKAAEDDADSDEDGEAEEAETSTEE